MKVAIYDLHIATFISVITFLFKRLFLYESIEMGTILKCLDELNPFEGVMTQFYKSSSIKS